MKKLYILLTLILALGACKPLKDGYGLNNPQQYSRVYLAAAYNGAQEWNVETPNPVPVKIYANYSGVIALVADITVTLEADLSLVSQYNIDNNKDFKAMPESHFSIEKDTSGISAGETTSTSPAIVNIITSAFSDESTYLLPVSIASVSDTALEVNSDLSTLYLAIRCKAGTLYLTTNPLVDYTISNPEKW